MQVQKVQFNKRLVITHATTSVKSGNQRFICRSFFFTTESWFRKTNEIGNKLTSVRTSCKIILKKSWKIMLKFTLQSCEDGTVGYLSFHLGGRRRCFRLLTRSLPNVDRILPGCREAPERFSNLDMLKFSYILFDSRFLIRNIRIVRS